MRKTMKLLRILIFDSLTNFGNRIEKVIIDLKKRGKKCQKGRNLGKKQKNKRNNTKNIQLFTTFAHYLR